MSELKRCPCCKGEAKIIHTHDILEDTYGAYIECQECFLRTKEIDTTLQIGDPMPAYNSIDFLIKSWNTRKPMDRIMERLEALRTCSDFGTCNHCQNRWCPMELLEADDAIKIVKEEGRSCSEN